MTWTPAHGTPPQDGPPPRLWCLTEWIGDWTPGLVKTTDENEWTACWSREYLELDGHEECCRHTNFVTVRALPIAASEDPSV